MKKIYSQLLLSFCLIGLASACSQTVTVNKTPDVQEIVVIDDGYKTNEEGEILMVDDDLAGQTLALSNEKSENQKQNGGDGSELKVMFDGFGNKTVTRFFYNHPLVSGIVSRISAKGNKQILLYSRDGQVTILPPVLSEFVSTATGDEIAKKAGIKILQNNEVSRPLADPSVVESADSDLVLENDLAKSEMEVITNDKQPVLEISGLQIPQNVKIGNDQNNSATTFQEQFEKKESNAKKASSKPIQKNK